MEEKPSYETKGKKGLDSEVAFNYSLSVLAIILAISSLILYYVPGYLDSYCDSHCELKYKEIEYSECLSGCDKIYSVNYDGVIDSINQTYWMNECIKQCKIRYICG